MGLLGKIQKNVRHAIADSLKRGREQGYSINNKLKRIASNIDNPIAAGALNGFIKFDELSAIPFRKMNEYLYDKIKPADQDAGSKGESTDVSPKPTKAPHKYMDRNTRIREFQNMIDRNMIPLSDENNDKNEI